MKKDFKYREIPYNYTSFSDKEIILKYFDEEAWDILNELRSQRVTGRSAKLLFEVFGDIFAIERNPYIYNDFLENGSKLNELRKVHRIRLRTVEEGAESNSLVLKIVEKAKEVDSQFFSGFSRERKFRKKVLYRLGEVTAKTNISFSGYHKVVHVTDATDWRVEYPAVVVYPENVEEIIGLIKAAKELDLKIIPRGGGTGLTGGVVPVYKNTMVMNTEKMREVGTIEMASDKDREIPIIEVEAGVITENVMHYCKTEGYIFATDPTSAWASTIGGNISENAGGKKAVIWGTAIDNIFSFKIVNAGGEILEVRRRNHPHRKILPEDLVVFDVYTVTNEEEQLVDSIPLKGTDIRKEGVGKDITNKALGGVPGIQKEGGDGIIVSAKFVLYKPFESCRTICLEFFGKNLINASNAIIDILESFEKNETVFLTALEHFDDKYESAINYRNKSERSELPKAVLLIDVESDTEKDLDAACQNVLDTVKQYNTEGFVAKDEQTREMFWKDRKNLGAIAKHTNAFKLNEDIVIPINALPVFADFIEMLNMRKELENNLALIEDLRAFFEKGLKKGFEKGLEEDDSFLATKVGLHVKELDSFDETLKLYTENLEKPVKGVITGDLLLDSANKTVFEYVRDNDLVQKITRDARENFRKLFHGYEDLLEEINTLVKERNIRKIIIATHMHAGDGNIHVNIPVLSNDYDMMLEADDTAGIVMEKTKELGGVISGEHGIGLTKLKFIDQEILDRYAEYKQEKDPDDLFNPGKLRSDFPISRIYTPSLNLLEMEAFILKAADLEQLTTSIAGCVRCGKCKEVCNTHSPRESMFYSPRNKILGVSLITEAILYDSQRSNRLYFRNFKMLREISNHCTGCHNCYTPCPVNIDFGDVTIAVRRLLIERKKAKFKFLTTFTLFYLRRRKYYINKLFRILILKIGFTSQRIGYYFNKPFSKITRTFFPKINYLLSGRFPRAGKRSLREILRLKGSNNFFAFHNPEKEIVKSVLYFPGCGSERMFPDISMASIALLYNAGVRVVIAPDYLCCGYPLRSNGMTRFAEIKSYENRIIFHRMADTIGYMGIEDVIISCGTCFEMLEKYQVENIFPNASVIDVNEFVSKEGLYNKDLENENILYHDPCHSPLKRSGAGKTFKTILNTEPVEILNCCGEGGTLALSTPDISSSLRYRKRRNISAQMDKKHKATVVTTCPSCVQGLSKIQGRVSISGKHLAVLLAEEFIGKGWKKQLIKDLKKKGGVEKIIL
ncbi:MAG: DUF3683 domain-containing protein [bacterium]|nr:DUF3683 domain-containing protein [bacterium]